MPKPTVTPLRNGGSGSSTDAHPAAAEHAGHADDRHEAAKRLVEAITARDLDSIVGTLASDARLRCLIPPGPRHIVGAAAAAAKFLQWFGDADVLRVQSVRVEPLADRISARYRFLLHQQEGGGDRTANVSGSRAEASRRPR